MTPLTMVPVMLSNGFMLASIAGLVVDWAPCAPIPEARGEPPIILRRVPGGMPCTAGLSSSVETQPQALPAALLVNARELARVRLELAGVRSRHRQRTGGS